jgi:predicted transposase YdaD
MGGVLKMSIDEIRKLHYKEEGREEGKEEERKQLVLKQYSKGFSIEYIAEINDFEVEYVKSVVDTYK